jgi:cobalt-precorrin-5B (C1)-methyltransferase
MKNCSAEFRFTGGKLLRRGFTTGSCAAAAAKAAAGMLLTGEPCETVALATPGGSLLTLTVRNPEIGADYALCAVQKDSGDDPDVTDGCLVYARVTRSEPGVTIRGGEGIGRVTKPGLDQPVGEAAINSVPRRMIREACEAVCRETQYTGGLAVTISIPGGGDLAKRTFNSRLGIEGGLSVLGTTGIVEPMSEAAILDTIRAELAVLRAGGQRELLLTVGNYGDGFARDILGLSLDHRVQCSNFIGETLASAAERGFRRVLLVGHIGKLVKLGIGVTNTHSRHGDGRIETLLACALAAGANLGLLRGIQGCVSTDAALELLREAGLLEGTMAALRERIRDTIDRHVAGSLAVSLICFSGRGDGTKEVFRL